MWPTLTALFGATLLLCLVGWFRQRRRWREQIDLQARELAVLRGQHAALVQQRSAEQEALFNSMVEGVLLLDEAGRIRLINRSLQSIFGLAGDVRGQSVAEALRLPELNVIVKRLQSECVVHDHELDLADSVSRRLEVNAAAVLDRDSVQSGSILVFHDLTRLKQLENTRQEFVANVSHELRTPLSLIKGCVETLQDGAKDNPETAARFLKIIAKHTERLTFLIEDLLTISRLESGEMLMNRHSVGLHAEVQRVVDDLQGRAREKHVTLENRVPEELRAKVDADRLQQVLMNLVENAIKYGRTAGKVCVAAEPQAEDRIKVWVQDDGPGIPSQAQARVFERFFRVDRARSRETGGTGLGLSIVKHIVQAHGGQVWLDSEVGRGTTFYFTIPSH